MRSRVSGVLPPAFPSLSAARVCVIGFTVVVSATLVSGCASKEGPRYAGAPLPQQVNERQWKVEIEEDGKPAQAPPVRRMRPEEDDPSQPWSPNYGRSGTSAPVPAAPVPQQSAPRTPWPKPVETSVRRRIADTDADALVARAVNAHEMRQP